MCSLWQKRGLLLSQQPIDFRAISASRYHSVGRQCLGSGVAFVSQYPLSPVLTVWERNMQAVAALMHGILIVAVYLLPQQGSVQLTFSLSLLSPLLHEKVLLLGDFKARSTLRDTTTNLQGPSLISGLSASITLSAHRGHLRREMLWWRILYCAGAYRPRPPLCTAGRRTRITSWCISISPRASLFTLPGLLVIYSATAI